MQSIREKVMNILLEVEKPARYIGNEWNTVKKDLARVDIKVALAFPEVYDLGMSHLGFKILYGLLNQQEDIAAERVYAPWFDMEAKMRDQGISLFSLESFLSVKDFDFLGFTFQYELTYTNILNMLDLGGIPLNSEDRYSEDPFVIAGGPSAFNPEPMAEFIDFYVLGDGEEVILEIMDKYREWKGQEDKSRKSFLKMVAELPGVYVPSFYQDYYDTGGNFEKLAPLDAGTSQVIKKRMVPSLDEVFYPVKSWIVPYLDIVHDRVMLEIFRGCTRGCRFCQAGILYRPVRERSPEKLKELACQIIDETGYEEISLTSLSSSDYSNIQPLIRELQSALKDKGVRVTLPSLRVDSFSVQLAKIIQKLKKSSLTFAPEAGTQRLRDVINKNVSEENLMSTAGEAFREGWNHIKLYFMIGLPTETDEDLEGIVNTVKKIVGQFKNTVVEKERKGRLKITISTSTFVPKPHTPFQWEPQISLEEMKRKQRYLRDKLRGRNMTYNWHNPEASFLEAVISRGDRRLSKVIYKAWEKGCRFDGWDNYLRFDRWQEAFKNVGLEPESYANRKVSLEANLPWDHINTGVSKKFLTKQYKLSLEGKTTSDCRDQCCLGCGVCEHPEINEVKGEISTDEIKA